MIIKTNRVASDGCQGLYWRASHSSYYDQDRGIYGSRRALRLLKKMSCAGCPECDTIKEVLTDSCSDYFPNIEYNLGNLYRTVWYYDTESVEFEEVK